MTDISRFNSLQNLKIRYFLCLVSENKGDTKKIYYSSVSVYGNEKKQKCASLKIVTVENR